MKFLIVFLMLALSACAGNRDPILDQLEAQSDCKPGVVLEIGPVSFPDGVRKAVKLYCADGCVEYRDDDGARIHYCE